MTVIAWDGKTLAADKQSTVGGAGFATTKIARNKGSLIGASGEAGLCRALRAWYAAGAKPDKYPVKASESDMLVVTAKGKVRYYDGNSGHAFEIEDRFFAIGSGRDFALAAMFLGKSAAEAVEIANHFSTGCGRGVDTLTL